MFRIRNHVESFSIGFPHNFCIFKGREVSPLSCPKEPSKVFIKGLFESKYLEIFYYLERKIDRLGPRN